MSTEEYVTAAAESSQSHHQLRLGLDAIGLQDNQHLKNSLINCEDPLKAISDFQEENSILLPTLKPALNILDLHNIKRLDFHMSICDELKEKLMRRVEELGQSLLIHASLAGSGKEKDKVKRQQQLNQQQQHEEEVRRLEELLEKSFPLICMPRLTHLVLLIMKSIPRINEIYLNYINDNENLYTIAPVEVKRQIWSLHTDVFVREIQPHIDKFISYMDESINNFDVLNQTSGSGGAQSAPVTPSIGGSSSAMSSSSTSSMSSLPADPTQPQLHSFNQIISHISYSNFFLKNTSKHRYMQPVNEILKLIGQSFTLYKFTMDRLEKNYLTTRNWFYSTLRNKLQMRMVLSESASTGDHQSSLSEVVKTTTQINQDQSMELQMDSTDATVTAITFSNLIFASSNIPSGESQSENIFKFASCICHCLKEKKIDQKRIKELEAIVDWKKFDKIIGHVSFILADPFVIDNLSRNCQFLLNRCVQTEILPRNSPDLLFVVRLLSIGLLSWEIIQSDASKEPKMDSRFITDYLPNVAYFIADYYEKVYDESLTALTNQMQAVPAPTTPSLLTSPKLIATTSPLAGLVGTTPVAPVVQPTTTLAPSAEPAEAASQPIVLKISTRKLEIISSLKENIAHNELCSCLYLYLIVACFELNDWSNLKVLLPTVRYPNNNQEQFEKWFVYLLMTLFNDKNIVEQFRQDWFISLIFDEFLLVIVSTCYAQIQQAQEASSSSSSSSAELIGMLTSKMNLFYEQIYKLVDRLFPSHITVGEFNRLIDLTKPKKINSSTVHILHMKLKNKLENAGTGSSTDMMV